MIIIHVVRTKLNLTISNPIPCWYATQNHQISVIPTKKFDPQALIINNSMNPPLSVTADFQQSKPIRHYPKRSTNHYNHSSIAITMPI
uniref:Uncharacterized protein n=1 Tax=Rhizophora mucronata TaxID=61149 RepID=A0A2P2NJU1_RHIMU